MSAKVLVADGSATMRKIIVRALAAFGNPEVVQVADGAQAVGAFRQQAFDLVLTDWSMPNKSGLEVLRAIREIDPHVPVVMVTAEDERRCVVEAINAGVSDYLLKPFTADGLREKLRSLSVLR